MQKKQFLKFYSKKKSWAGLAGYVENGMLSHEGIECACQGLIEFKERLRLLNIQNVSVFAHCFATEYQQYARSTPADLLRYRVFLRGNFGKGWSLLWLYRRYAGSFFVWRNFCRYWRSQHRNRILCWREAYGIGKLSNWIFAVVWRLCQKHSARKRIPRADEKTHRSRTGTL